MMRSGFLSVARIAKADPEAFNAPAHNAMYEAKHALVMQFAKIDAQWSLGALHDQRLRQLAAYWEGLRCGRAAPSREDVDPAQMAPLLPYVFMADVLPLDFRFRLAGTHFFDATGSDPTGKPIAEVFPADYRDEVRLHWREAVEQVRPKVGSGDLWVRGKDHLRWEGVVLPLASDRGVVDILLGGFITALIAPEPPRPCLEADAELIVPADERSRRAVPPAPAADRAMRGGLRRTC